MCCMKMWKLICALLFVVTLTAPALATELGVIYYHETMMTRNGEHYIARTPEGVAQDMQNIKEISSHVKLFVNPYVDANADWTEQVNTLAKQAGMHTVVTMMVDDRKLTAGNWPEYRTKVLALCERFNGKADEFHVGNEIILHSEGLTREQIRDNVIELMGACRTKFSGPVSYQELWWSHQVWVGNPEKIYFMTYENFDVFQGIIAELKEKHPNAAIGEWGEDLQEDSAQKDEVWQKDQIERRWNLIQQSGVPIAYIFTYREPNWNGFGIIRPETELRRPLWEVFGAELKWNQTAPPVNTTPVNHTPPVNNTPPVNSTPPVNTTPPINTTNSTPPVVPPPVNTTVETNSTNETNTTDVIEEPPEERRRSGGGGGGSSRLHREREEQREQEEFERQAAEAAALYWERREEETADERELLFGVDTAENSTLNESNTTFEPINVPAVEVQAADGAAGSAVHAEQQEVTLTQEPMPPEPDERFARDVQERAEPVQQEPPGFLERIWQAIVSIFS